MAVQAQLYSENLGFPLGGSQDLLMDNACGFNEFSFNLQQQKQQQQQNHQMHFQQLQNMQQNRNQNFCFNKNVLRPENGPSMVFDQSLAPQMKKQRLDIDRLISLQSERLRIALQEQKKQQLAFLLKKYETETQILLRQKDEEIAKAVNRTMELEHFLIKMETENQAWQRVAKENEAIIITLNNTIDELREKNACQTGNGADDAESCCDIMTEKRADQTRGGNWEHDESEHQSGEHKTRKMICKSCNSRNSCVILLPCRHLCSCKDCEAYIASCPVCKMPKKGSIEALI